MIESRFEDSCGAYQIEQMPHRTIVPEIQRDGFILQQKKKFNMHCCDV